MDRLHSWRERGLDHDPHALSWADHRSGSI